MKIEYYSLIISILAMTSTISSWFIIHWLNQKRDFSNKKKEIRIKYLISAWELLESASNRKTCTHESEIEKAIANIQLLGTVEQIKLARDLAIELSKNEPTVYTKLLINLRDDLRKELNIEGKGIPDFISLRFEQ